MYKLNYFLNCLFLFLFLQACVSIRKGKQINSFEYIIKFEWLYSKKKEGKDYFGGSVEIPDFSTFSLEVHTL